MDFQEICAQLGIKTYPEALDGIYAQKPVLPVTKELLFKQQKDLDLFGEFFDDVIRGYDDLLEKPAELAWTATACTYLQTANHVQARALELPAADGSPARDMLPLFVLLSRLEQAMAEYVRRGFTQAETQKLMGVFQSDFRANIRHCGRPGVNKSYYDWTILFMYCVLLSCRGFKFDIRKNPTCATLLYAPETGENVVLVHNVMIHKTGHRLGTVGCTEEDGAFCPTLEETDTHWIGYPANRAGLVFNQKNAYPKDRWQMVAKPGDSVLGIHIPRGMDIRPEAVRYAIDGVIAHMKQYYPEYDIKAIHCSSWMLNPELGALVGQQSKLAAFSDLFCRYPTVSNGKAVFGFVFEKGSNPDLQTLPENTSLQRAIKQRYLNGGYVHVFGGYIFI